MALRKEEFDMDNERARIMSDDQFIQHDNIPIEISQKLYRRIEAEAARRHLTVGEYMEQLLDETVPEIDEFIQPGHPPTRASIERLRKFREQVFRENNYQYMGNSVEELREAREERTRQLMGEDYKDE
jgi:hypothetical protein